MTAPETLTIDQKVDSAMQMVETWRTADFLTAEAQLEGDDSGALECAADSAKGALRRALYAPYARIAELEAKASENYWLLYAMKEQELWYQDELVEEAKRTAAEKLRADQMTEQHRMQSAMNTEARGELAQLREKRQPTHLYRLLRSGELMREGDECLDDGTMTWHPVRNGWHSFPWSVINNPVRRVIEAAHNITGEPA